ncbi:MAG: MBOAT family O-acyltransferase [Lachnospiraceae bacterium]|nr:MBOAT family O-acyltransferase [Lachnospiraceae bacterium]
MVFSSLIFLFVFLSVHLLLYRLAGRKYKNAVLLVSSLLFYAWGGPRYLLLLLLETAVSWFFAKKIDEAKDLNPYDNRMQKVYLALTCIILLGLLAVFKYLGFFMQTIKDLTGVPIKVLSLALPIGISFYTFQLLSYVVDVYRGQVPAQLKYWKLLLYSSLFHQCIAGPIVRYETVRNEIDERKVTYNDVYLGVRRFSVGLAKKAILANSCAVLADTFLAVPKEQLMTQSVLGLWFGVGCYMLQIYFDFSAYSDMAIGMGRMVGFHYMENFNYPYIAASVQEFWRRWHISLSSFFRDYVYIPLGGSRVGAGKVIRNLFVVWFLTGLWHGASVNYILWGLYYFLFLLLERYVIKGRMPKLLGHCYTLLVVFFGWAIFKFENMGELWIVIKGLLGFNNAAICSMEVKTQFLSHIFFLLFAMIAVTPFGKLIRKTMLQMGTRRQKVLYLTSLLDMITPVLLFLLAALALVGNSYNPFLYFQF